MLERTPLRFSSVVMTASHHLCRFVSRTLTLPIFRSATTQRLPSGFRCDLWGGGGLSSAFCFVTCKLWPKRRSPPTDLLQSKSLHIFLPLCIFCMILYFCCRADWIIALMSMCTVMWVCASIAAAQGSIVIPSSAAYSEAYLLYIYSTSANSSGDKRFLSNHVNSLFSIHVYLECVDSTCVWYCTVLWAH